MALIYIVEDDENIREIETIALKNSNYMVCAFEKAKDFYRKLEDIMPDLVLLDVMLPDESGYDIVRKLRKDPTTRQLPIIMVTAKTAEMDMIKGLDEGADDYIKKPFSIMELITRVKALLRRTITEDIKYLQVDNLVLDHERHMVFVDNKQVELTFKEYELLRLLMTNQNVVLSREVIMRPVWGTEFSPPNSVPQTCLLITSRDNTTFWLVIRRRSNSYSLNVSSTCLLSTNTIWR